jgi:hypothetical protein
MTCCLSPRRAWVAQVHQAMWFELFSTGGDEFGLVQAQSPTQSPCDEKHVFVGESDVVRGGTSEPQAASCVHSMS